MKKPTRMSDPMCPEDKKEIQDAKQFMRDIKEFKAFMATLSEDAKEGFRELMDLPEADNVYRMVLIGRKIRGMQEESKLPADQPIAEKVKHVKRAGQSRNHYCHWPGCEEQVPPAKWSCSKHWFKLPKRLRDAVWVAYRPGQEINGTPSREYLKAAREVQAWIKENYKS